MDSVHVPSHSIFDPITEEATEEGVGYFKFCQSLCEQAIVKAKEMGIPLRQAQCAFLDSTGFPFARATAQKLRLIEERDRIPAPTFICKTCGCEFTGYHDCGGLC